MSRKTRQTIKAILIIIGFGLLVFFIATQFVRYAEEMEATPEDMSVQFVEVEQSVSWTLYADKDTRVLYIMKDGGGITAVLNADETPRIWNGEIP